MYLQQSHQEFKFRAWLSQEREPAACVSEISFESMLISLFGC